jgi:hypothetical protein
MSNPDNEKAVLAGGEQTRYVHDEIHQMSSSNDEAHDNLHLRNELAYKGDDSDGQVSWTARNIAAACSLGALFTGAALRRNLS